LRESHLPVGRDDLREVEHGSENLVSRYVPDGINSLRHQREADSARDGRYLQNRVGMFRQIRKLMGEELRLGGASGGGVEMDEMYHGGRRKGNLGGYC